MDELMVGYSSRQEMILHIRPCFCDVDHRCPTVGVVLPGLLILFCGIVYALNVRAVVLIRPSLLAIWRRQRDIETSWHWYLNNH